jgi:hypothetical protein
VFAGPLQFDADDQGSHEHSIVVTSYGTGRATIDGGDDAGLFAYNTAGLSISNINLIGSGPGSNESNGINFYNDLAGDVRLDGVRITEVEVSGFGKNGILIGGWNGQSGFRNIHITQAMIHDNGLNGLVTYGQWPHANEHAYIAHVQSYRNSGTPTAKPSSGSGIILGSVNAGIIEWSVAHDNGWLGNAGIGIWTYASNNIVIQHNESFDNRTSGTADGGGFGLDGGVTDSVLQYNYSHGNDGAGYGLFQYENAFPWFGNRVRYNLSFNDGQKNGFAGIQIWNGGSGLLAEAQIHDNIVVVIGASGQAPPHALSFKTESSTFSVHHNTFIALGEAGLLRIASAQRDLSFAANRCWCTENSANDDGLYRQRCEIYHGL